jgi:hypothetical protein
MQLGAPGKVADASVPRLLVMQIVVSHVPQTALAKMLQRRGGHFMLMLYNA